MTLSIAQIARSTSAAVERDKTIRLAKRRLTDAVRALDQTNTSAALNHIDKAARHLLGIPLED